MLWLAPVPPLGTHSVTTDVLVTHKPLALRWKVYVEGFWDLWEVMWLLLIQVLGLLSGVPSSLRWGVKELECERKTKWPYAILLRTSPGHYMQGKGIPLSAS